MKKKKKTQIYNTRDKKVRRPNHRFKLYEYYIVYADKFECGLSIRL